MAAILRNLVRPLRMSSVSPFLLVFVLFLGFLTGCRTTRSSGRGSELKFEELLFVETARASFYSDKFRGRRTANGEKFNPELMTAAHPTLPFGTLVVVRRRPSGQFVVVRINDRGPYIKGRRIDLSEAAAGQLGILRRGVAPVDIFVVPERSRFAAML